MQDRFLILGCQRTGTTLIRLILESHPEIFCYDELNSYAVLQKSVIVDPPSAHWVGFKIPRWTEQLTSQILFDEGLEGHYDNFYRGDKILFLFRDVRDTITSMLKLKAGQSTWCEKWVPPIISAKLSRDKTFCARYAGELSAVGGSSRRRLLALAALYWKYKTESFFSYRDRGFPVLAVSYEQLVTTPRPVLQRVCDHLGAPFHDNLLRHNQLPHAEVFENGLTIGNTDPARPIQTASVEQWRAHLMEEDLKLIARISGDLPDRITALFQNDAALHMSG